MGDPKFTPGPWRWELNRTAKRVELCGGPRFDLTVVSFGRYGMSNAAPIFWSWNERNIGTPQRADELAASVTDREHHSDWFADVSHPNAHLIAAAPALYEALVLAAEELATIAVGMGEDGWSANDIERHESICAIGDRISAALAKARGDLVDPLEQVKL